jgi:hypothetical protein
MSGRGQGGELPSVEDRVDELNEAVSLFVDKVEQDFDVELDFDPDSIAYLDLFLTEAQRRGSDLAPSLYLSIGGYLGETLIRSYGGEWADAEDSLAVELEGEAHNRQLEIFDWVENAYDDPHGESLGQRMRTVLGDDLSSGGAASE